MYLPLPLLLLLPQALFGSMFLEGQGKKWPWLEGKGRSQEALLHTDCSGRLVMGRSLWRAEQIHHGGRKAKSFWSRLGNWLLVRTWRILEQVWPVDPWKPHDLFKSLGGENCSCTKEGMQHTLLMSVALSSCLSDGGGRNGPRFMWKPDPHS